MSLVCRCLLVDERTVRRAIRGGARTIEAVGRACEAGTGCGSCQGLIEQMLDAEAERLRARAVAPRAQLGLFDGDGTPA